MIGQNIRQEWVYGNKEDVEICEFGEHEAHRIGEGQLYIDYIYHWCHIIESQTDSDWAVHVWWIRDSELLKYLDQSENITKQEVVDAYNRLNKSFDKPEKFNPPEEELI